jgi:hypothetical protein
VSDYEGEYEAMSVEKNFVASKREDNRVGGKR